MDLTFDPPAVNEANLRHPVDFHARATGWMPATDPLELELILGGGSSANERRFPMRLEGDAYHVKAEPTATPPTPSFIQIEALFDDGTIAGRVEDRTVAIAGARLVGLGTLRRLRPAARTVALLGNGETLAGGSVSGLGEATVTVGGQPLTVDLGRARMIAVKPPVEFPAILCTVVARRAAREVSRLDAPIYREDRVAPCLEAVRDGRFIRPARSDTPVTYVSFVSGTPERFDGERYQDKPFESEYPDRSVAFAEGDVTVRLIGVENVARVDMVAGVGQRVQRTNRARGVTVTTAPPGKPDLWQFEFEAPHGQILAAGDYPDARGMDVGGDAPEVRFSAPIELVKGLSHLANQLFGVQTSGTGHFVVWEIEVNDNQVTRLAVDFVGRCQLFDGYRHVNPYYGMIRYRSTFR